MSLPKPDTLRRLVDEAAEKAKRFKAVCSDSHDDVSALTDFEDEQPNKKPLIVESSSAESYCSDRPLKQAQRVPVAFMIDLRCPTPAPMDQSFDEALLVDSAIPQTEPPMLKQIYEYIGKYVERVEAVSLPSPGDALIHSSLQPLSAATSRPALTKACITKCHTELQNSLKVNKLKNICSHRFRCTERQDSFLHTGQ